jgi:hypothetical protein
MDTFALLSTSLIALSSASERRGDDYIAVERRGDSYEEAELFCQNTYGTSLASIHSQEQQDEAYGLCGQGGYCYIGLNDVDVEGTFVWTDGSPFDYTGGWSPGQPDNEANNEHCVMMHGPWRGWNDFGCSGGGNGVLCNLHNPKPITGKPTSNPTAFPTIADTGCEVFDIDGFLTECSVEFPAAKREIDEVHGSAKGMIADLEAAQTATSGAVDVLSANVESEIARVDGEQQATNDAVSALDTKVDGVVQRLEDEQSSTNEAVTAVDTKVDTEMQRVDGLIDNIKDDLDVMANLRARHSAAGFGDYLQVDEENNVHLHASAVKTFIALIVIWAICAPIAAVWIAMKFFKNGGKVNKYKKVEIMSSDCEDNALIVN